MARKQKIGDIVITTVLVVWGLTILLPFLNVVMISFTTEKEYLQTPVLVFPTAPTLANYAELFSDGRIWIGYSTTLKILLIGLPLNLFLTTSFAYGLSRKGFPGRQLIFYMVLFTMIFNGGIIPMYLLMKQLRLTNSIYSVVLSHGINTFYMIIMRNFFARLPDSLLESARLDGAGEWRVLWSIILPVSAPIMATITLFCTVDRWNEWFNAMIFIQKAKLQPLQLVLRGIVLESQVLDILNSSASAAEEVQRKFSMGIKTGAIICTMLPVMCVFPFLQRHFVKGIMIGSIKS
jgi:putative aldouronate transport system permease protein